MIITEILSQKIADRIIIVPSGKRRDKTSYAVTDKNRLGMLEYLIKDIDNKNISVDSSFLSVPPEQGSTVVLHKYYTKKF
jgi:nicotinic acid mononucleotide adenylyltransferase